MQFSNIYFCCNHQKCVQLEDWIRVGSAHSSSSSSRSGSSHPAVCPVLLPASSWVMRTFNFKSGSSRSGSSNSAVCPALEERFKPSVKWHQRQAPRSVRGPQRAEKNGLNTLVIEMALSGGSSRLSKFVCFFKLEGWIFVPG